MSHHDFHDSDSCFAQAAFEMRADEVAAAPGLENGEHSAELAKSRHRIIAHLGGPAECDIATKQLTAAVLEMKMPGMGPTFKIAAESDLPIVLSIDLSEVIDMVRIAATQGVYFGALAQQIHERRHSDLIIPDKE